MPALTSSMSAASISRRKCAPGTSSTSATGSSGCDKIRVLHRDKLNRCADQSSAFVPAEAGRARHVAIGVEIERTVEAGHRVLQAVEAGQRVTDLLAVLRLALRGVGGMGAAQRRDQQSYRVVALRPPPTRPLARRGGVTLGEFLAPGADRVEDYCGGGEKVVGEEARG